MLDSDKSGLLLEMICADFVAGAHLDKANPDILLDSFSRHYRFLPDPRNRSFCSMSRKRAQEENLPKQPASEGRPSGSPGCTARFSSHSLIMAI